MGGKLWVNTFLWTVGYRALTKQYSRHVNEANEYIIEVFLRASKVLSKLSYIALVMWVPLLRECEPRGQNQESHVEQLQGMGFDPFITTT